VFGTQWKEDKEMEEEFDPFALGGYAEEDKQIEDYKAFLEQRVPKAARQQSLFGLVLEAIERKEKADGKSA